MEEKLSHITSATYSTSEEASENLESVIQTGIDRVNGILLENAHHENQSIQRVAEHVLISEGKRIRARFILISFLCYKDKLNDKILNLASAAELFHTASLLHDDVLDESPVRRGKITVNEKWDSRTAVLLGDFLLSRTFKLIDSVESQEIMRIFVDTAQTLGEGALTEQFHKDDLSLNEKTYLYIIKRKTATFFRMCASVGAMLCGAPESDLDNLKSFGLNYGLAFQITDDLMDLISDQTTMGKPRGQDLLKGHLTLPLIDYFGANPERIPSRKLSDLTETDSEFIDLISEINADGILTRSYDKAREYMNKALASLDSLPDRPALQIFRNNAKDVLTRRA